jgi:hypothetical protein
LTGTFIAAEGDLFDGLVELGLDAVQEGLKELEQLLLFERGQDEFQLFLFVHWEAIRLEKSFFIIC